jgi:hypothetical protein
MHVGNKEARKSFDIDFPTALIVSMSGRTANMRMHAWTRVGSIPEEASRHGSLSAVVCL